MKAAIEPSPSTSVWGGGHLAVLDGWRGLSILLVMAGHMLPVGPTWMHLNEPVAAAGMAIFFVLSGFLITTTLLRHPSVPAFLVKRLFRILPLAWTFILFVMVLPGAPGEVVAANLLFYANGSEAYLKYAPHFWSLSIEMQFYLFVAALVLLGGRRALYVLPVVGLLVTIGRVDRGAVFLVGTFDRADEIIAGAILALILSGRRPVPTSHVAGWASAVLMALLLSSSHVWIRQHLPVIAYLRPYLAALVVGLSFSHPHAGYRRLLESALMRYVAGISYALYVIHPLTYAGWLGSGDTAVRYTKRVLSIALAFGGAHLSSFYFEGPFTRLGHQIAARIAPRSQRVAAA